MAELSMVKRRDEAWGLRFSRRFPGPSRREGGSKVDTFVVFNERLCSLCEKFMSDIISETITTESRLNHGT